MMTLSELTLVFKLLDEYSRENHQCFIAEMDPRNDARTEYSLCFRPTNESINPDHFACRYLRFSTEQFEPISQSGVLPVAITEQLDKELAALGHPEGSR